MGADGCFWKEWQEAEKTNTVRHFFPWWLEPAYVAAAPEAASLTDAEQQLMREHGLLPEQIGYRRQIQRNFRGLAKQEYAEDPTACFLASGDCFFETGAIDARLGAVQRPVAERHNGALHIWLTPQAGREYLVAVDPAGGGVSGDFTAIQMIDLQSGLQCAEWRSRLTPLETAQEAAALAREYHGALLAVERNNQGEAVLAHLRAICRYHRIFQEQQRDGWLTKSFSRPQMLGKLSAALVEAPTSSQRAAAARVPQLCAPGQRARPRPRPANTTTASWPWPWRWPCVKKSSLRSAGCSSMRKSGGAVTVRATQQIGRMRGGAQSHLMLGDDGNAWVVKFQNNPAASARAAQRTAGDTAGVPDRPDHAALRRRGGHPWLIERTPELEMDYGHRRERCRAGLHFGSQLVGGLMPGHVADYLPEEQLMEVRNLREFAGALVLDKWTCNANGRQALFYRKGREAVQRDVHRPGILLQFRGVAVLDAPLRGVYARNASVSRR